VWVPVGIRQPDCSCVRPDEISALVESINAGPSIADHAKFSVYALEVTNITIRVNLILDVL
jgi:hypothetical protein